jgi:hypothetical protein
MPLTPLPGSARLRAFQLGKESTFKTQVPATRRYPWDAAPTVDPHWTTPTADTGTLDDALAPYRTGLDLTIQTTGQLAANDAPTWISAGVMGGLSFTGGGTAKTLTASPASTSQDVFDTYTAEWFDDATADAWAGTGFLIDKVLLDYPQDQGPIYATLDWRGAAAVYPSTPTGALTVDVAPTYLFAADTEFYVNDTSGAIETTKLTDIAYSAQLTIENSIDPKRIINGSNTRFQIQNYSRGKRTVTFSMVGAKQTAWIAEAVKWIGVNPTERFWGIKTTSPVLAEAGVNYSLDIRLPGYWKTRSEQTINQNTAFQLTGTNVYDAGLGYPFHVVSVSTRTTL